ncbi:paralemmin-3 [Clinocottus analis]|uniref:paralemmin-3 n=1 Tax=Clinocottus analis TaxID=304258 RepID=UPI0035C1B140
MDETEKYKQRLEAIAEKRRLQEDQDRARRDVEDEKLRLQQLKRKSLRDQWLMEGAPLSPSSPDAQSPRSPLWGSQTQEMEKHIDKLESESQRLAEEEETLKEQMGDGQTEARSTAEAEAEMDRDAVVQNGENNGSDEGNTTSPPLDETAAVLTNGDAGGGGVGSGSGSGSGSRSRLSLAVSEAEEEEEEEGTLVMRAERVIVTDEGDDSPDQLTPQQEAAQTEEAGRDGGEAFTPPEKSEATDPTAEERSAPGAGDEGRDEDSEGPASAAAHPRAGALEGAAVASVPVYPEAQPPSVLGPELEAEVEAAATSPEGAEAASEARGPAVAAAAAAAGSFQEVPLAEPQESSQRTEARPAEQEPLLTRAKANDAQAAAAAPAAAAAAETRSSSRAGQRDEAEAPKHKTCQCCSVM